MNENELNLARQVFSRVIAQLNGSSDQVVNYLPPEALAKELNLKLSAQPVTNQELVSFLDLYIKYSVNTSHKQFFNQLWSGFSFPSWISQMVTSALNTSMYTYEVAPVATLMERYFVKHIGQLVGFSKPSGLLTSGGSQSNLHALLMARNFSSPEASAHGMYDQKKLVIFTSEAAHYSIEKSAHILGLGKNQVVKVEVNAKGEMLPSDLATKIEQSLKRGDRPACVVATSGTTVEGAFDPLETIGKIARHHQMWFHVDAAYGGSVLLSDNQKHLMKGIEFADSLTWDFHKMLSVNLPCSLLLFNNQESLDSSVRTDGDDYIFHQGEEASYDLGPQSLQCGRSVDILKIWLFWNQSGKKGLAEQVNRLFELTKYAESIVVKNPKLRLSVERSSINLCFQFISQKYQSGEINVLIRDEIKKRGLALVNYASLNGQKFIRLAITNPQLSEADLDQFFDFVVKEGERIESAAP